MFIYVESDRDQTPKDNLIILKVEDEILSLLHSLNCESIEDFEKRFGINLNLRNCILKSEEHCVERKLIN